MNLRERKLTHGESALLSDYRKNRISLPSAWHWHVRVRFSGFFDSRGRAAQERDCINTRDFEAELPVRQTINL